MTRTFLLRKIPETFAICKLSPDDPIPHWATSGKIWSVTRTDSELSIVCPQANLPQDLPAKRNWCALRVVGPLPFEMVGVVATLTSALAYAEVSIFAISTYDTDLLLVRAESFESACKALTSAGHTVAPQ